METDNGKRRACYPVPSEDALDDRIKNLRLDEAVIIFEDAFLSPNSSTGRLPERLSYTVRMNENFMTHVYEALDESNGPHENFGIIYEPFMRVQWAIDSSYISLRRGSPLRQRVQVQEFPHNEVIQAEMAMTVVRYTLVQFLAAACLALVFMGVVVRLSEERASGVQELIKMAGVKGSTIALSYIIDATPMAIIFSVIATVLLTVTENSLVQTTHWSIVFVFLLLLYYNIVAMAFLASYLIKSQSHLVSISLVVYYCLLLVAYLTTSVDERPRVLLALPHMPNTRFWPRLRTAELTGEEDYAFLGESDPFESHLVSIESQLVSISLVVYYWLLLAAYLTTTADERPRALLALPHMPNKRFWPRLRMAELTDTPATLSTVYDLYLALIVQGAVYALLAWYASKVLPGQYGVPLPWNFLFRSPPSGTPATLSTVYDLYLALIVQGAVYALLAWYASKVLPGQYGVPLPWNFLFRRHRSNTINSIYDLYLALIVQGAVYALLAWYASTVLPGQYGVPLPWNFLFRSPPSGAAATLSTVYDLYLALIVQGAVYALLTWYASKVLPGQYGVPLPWNFLFRKEYWRAPVTPAPVSEADSEEDRVAAPDPSYFEPPADRPVGIKLNNVTKEYGSWYGRKFRALSNVTLDIYKGEITVLLGHNGAGKTTLNSIITGVYCCFSRK
ncbi:hypothetical protein JYU34_014721 [Plutella xylostella]|uniref:ABC transporter domain-containing protein n=1 Tax=Plutella xylostella TaxID=51655 RepID=A0ABQ7Q9B3_PLUXY|nr:hypothetical protein JYU34_014721 [Plutella xylostella]